MIKKAVVAVVIGWIGFSIIGLYTTFVIQNLWNWFATPALHVSEISFWGMYGFVLLVSLFTAGFSDQGHDEHNWKMLFSVLDACVPEEKREWVKDQLEDYTQSIWTEALIKGFSIAFGKVFANTLTLGTGWGIHTFLT